MYSVIIIYLLPLLFLNLIIVRYSSLIMFLCYLYFMTSTYIGAISIFLQNIINFDNINNSYLQLWLWCIQIQAKYARSLNIYYMNFCKKHTPEYMLEYSGFIDSQISFISFGLFNEYQKKLTNDIIQQKSNSLSMFNEDINKKDHHDLTKDDNVNEILAKLSKTQSLNKKINNNINDEILTESSQDQSFNEKIE
jgi:hypothetical protein